jgi:twitching motility protein PilT
MADIQEFLKIMIEKGASDLHVAVNSPPLVRVDGDLSPLPYPPLTPTDTKNLTYSLLTEAQKHRFEEELELDFSFAVRGLARFRGNLFLQKGSVGGAFRAVPYKIQSFQELGLPPIVNELCKQPRGLVLVTGPTGSGKTTSLASMVDKVNLERREHVVTVEDPIEFVHDPDQSVVTQRQVGKHVDSFASALRSALRESPDVLVVGEMRDLATVSLALQAAETGVLVFGTLHTNSAAKAIDRMIDVFPEEQHEQVRGLLSVLLKGVVAQTLVKRMSGEGRLAAFEVLLHNYAIANMIRENKVYQIDSYLQSSESAGAGMIGLDQCLLSYVRERLVDPEEAMRHANYPDTLQKSMAPLLEAG